MMLDKRKGEEELGLAKSAAWAWYERGSGSDRRSIREVDAGWRRKKMDPKPSSRYKLEAAALIRSNMDVIQPSSLLDTYEVDRISKHLQHYIDSSNRANIHGGATVAEPKNVEAIQKKKKKTGFWSRRGPVCGSSTNDVVENHRRRRHSN